MNPDSDMGFKLVCPHCGGTYLHHMRVEVFERGEDEQRGVHVSIQGKEVKIDTDISGNPSKRRHGLEVSFWCEGCHKISSITFAQHKGDTLCYAHPLNLKIVFDSEGEWTIGSCG